MSYPFLFLHPWLCLISPPCRVLLSVILLFLCLIVKVGPKNGVFRVSNHFHYLLFLYSTLPYTVPCSSITGYWFTLQMHALCIVSTRLKFTPSLSPFHNIHILPYSCELFGQQWYFQLIVSQLGMCRKYHCWFRYFRHFYSVTNIRRITFFILQKTGLKTNIVFFLFVTCLTCHETTLDIPSLEKFLTWKPKEIKGANWGTGDTPIMTKWYHMTEVSPPPHIFASLFTVFEFPIYRVWFWEIKSIHDEPVFNAPLKKP